MPTKKNTVYISIYQPKAMEAEHLGCIQTDKPAPAGALWLRYDSVNDVWGVYRKHPTTRGVSTLLMTWKHLEAAYGFASQVEDGWEQQAVLKKYGQNGI